MAPPSYYYNIPTIQKEGGLRKNTLVGMVNSTTIGTDF